MVRIQTLAAGSLVLLSLAGSAPAAFAKPPADPPTRASEEELALGRKIVRALFRAIRTGNLAEFTGSCSAKVRAKLERQGREALDSLRGSREIEILAILDRLEPEVQPGPGGRGEGTLELRTSWVLGSNTFWFDLTLVREEGRWVLDELGHGKTNQPPPPIPTAEECLRLIRPTFKSFAAGLKRRDFRAFHGECSSLFQAGTTPEDIGLAFQPLIDAGADLGDLEKLRLLGININLE